MNLVHPVTGQNVEGGRNWSCIGKGEYIRGLQDENDVERTGIGRTDGQTTGHARALRNARKNLIRPKRDPKSQAKGGDRRVEVCGKARLYGRRLLRMFHPLFTHGRALVRGQSPRARRGRCHFQNKKGNSVSIREGRTEQRRGFRSSNSKRTRLKKREGGKESYFHSVTRKGKREYPWVGIDCGSAVALAKSRPVFTAFSGIPGKIEKQITFIEQIHHTAQSPTIYLVRIE